MDGENEQIGWPVDETAPTTDSDNVTEPVAEAGAVPSVQTGAQEAARSGEKKRRALSTILEIVVIVAAAFAIAMVVQAFLVKPFTIHQVSMEPTLIEGDRILINRLTYHFRDPKHGDIIVFHSPVTQGEDLVKRVIAVGGETISINNGKVYVNGVLQNEPYLLEQGFTGEPIETKVPAGKLWVMGDNRNNSGDSRYFGPIDRSSVIGCAFVVYWPIKHWKGL